MASALRFVHNCFVQFCGSLCSKDGEIDSKGSDDKRPAELGGEGDGEVEGPRRRRNVLILGGNASCLFVLLRFLRLTSLSNNDFEGGEFCEVKLLRIFVHNLNLGIILHVGIELSYFLAAPYAHVFTHLCPHGGERS